MNALEKQSISKVRRMIIVAIILIIVAILILNPFNIRTNLGFEIYKIINFSTYNELTIQDEIVVEFHPNYVMEIPLKPAEHHMFFINFTNLPMAYYALENPKSFLIKATSSWPESFEGYQYTFPSIYSLIGKTKLEYYSKSLVIGTRDENAKREDLFDNDAKELVDNMYTTNAKGEKVLKTKEQLAEEIEASHRQKQIEAMLNNRVSVGEDHQYLMQSRDKTLQVADALDRALKSDGFSIISQENQTNEVNRTKVFYQKPIDSLKGIYASVSYEHFYEDKKYNRWTLFVGYEINYQPAQQ